MLFRLCGLVISSNDALPGLLCDPRSQVDVQVRSVTLPKSFSLAYNWFMHWYLANGEKWLSVSKVEGGFLLRFNELADFFVRDDSQEIVCMPKAEIPSNTIQHLLLDQVIPLVINLKGGEALHASAVLTRYGLVAFSGPAGFGKSTLAASFLSVGNPLLGDDCLGLLEEDGDIYGVPAYPGLRLFRDSSTWLFGNNGTHTPVAHYSAKVQTGIERKIGAFCDEPQLLRRVYVIADPAEAEGKSDTVIERLSPQSRFMALIRAAFRLDITDRSMLRRQFRFFERAISCISVRQLSFPRELDLLPAVREAILEDLKSPEN